MRNTTRAVEALLSVLIAILALVVGSIFSVASARNPLDAFLTLASSSFGSVRNLAFTLTVAGPLIIASVGILVAFRAGMWNIGGEGQIYLGAFFGLAAAVGASQLGWSIFTGLPVTFLAAFAGGGAWAFISGFLKAKFRIDEIVTSLMLNFVGVNVVLYQIRVPYSQPTNFIETPQSMNIPYVLSSFGGVSISLPIAIAITATIYFLMSRSTFGFKMKLMGDNRTTAAYAGVNVPLYMMLSMFISGGILGVAGISLVSGYTHAITTTISNGYGYIAIAVALLSTLNALALLPASIFFAMLFAGSYGLTVNLHISSSLSLVIAAVAIIFTTIRPVLVERLRRRSAT